MNQNGKGDRPRTVNMQRYRDNYQQIFRKKKQNKKK
jgi:hypothetical protein